MDDFYWHLDYGVQKPAFEKLSPNNGAPIFNIDKSFSICSDRILDSDRSNSKHLGIFELHNRNP